MSSNGGLAQPGSPRRGRAGLFASHPATTAPSEEDAGGLTRDRALILLAHLTLSVGHIFAVHQSSSGDADAKGGASGARGYKYSPATVVFLVRGPRPSPRSPRVPCRPVSRDKRERSPPRPARLTTPPPTQAELFKLIFSVATFARVVERRHEGDPAWTSHLLAEVREAFADHRHLRFAIPALIYLVENHVRFVVLKELASPITWVVFSHVEIPIVAVLSFLILRRPITRVQWIAVALLLDGVMAAEIALCHANGGDDADCDSADAYPLFALALVLFGATLAALAGIAVEYTYKGDFQTSIHLQNAQLYAFGVVANGLVAAYGYGGDGLSLRGFDAGTWWVVVTLAAFGIVSSLIMKHLSNIAKVFNSAAGMVVVTTASWAFLGTAVTLPFFLAASVVVWSLLLFYSGGDGKTPARVLGPGVKQTASIAMTPVRNAREWDERGNASEDAKQLL